MSQALENSPHWEQADKGRRIDPYLVWAEITNWAHFAQSPNESCLYSVLIELTCDATISDLCEADRKASSDNPAVHVDPIYEGFQFIAAQVTKEFFDKWAHGIYAAIVQRFELCEPVTGLSSTFGMRASRVNVAETWAYKYARDADLPGFKSVVGIIDYGCPFANREFRYSQDRTRVIALWDQNEQNTIKDPELNIPGKNAFGTSYGSFLDENQLGKAIANTPPEQTEDWAYKEKGINYRQLSAGFTHGAHVMSVAAGARKNVVRPELSDDREPIASTIGFVQLPERATAGSAGLWLGKLVLDGLHVLRQLLPEDSPKRKKHAEISLVANVSFGPLHGPHDGTAMLEQAMLEMLEKQENMAITLPSGNGFLSRSHAWMKVAEGKEESLIWHIMPDSAQPSFAEIWLPENMYEHVTITLGPPASDVSEYLVVRQCEACSLGTRNGSVTPLAAAIFSPAVSRGNHGTMVLLAIGPTSIPAGRRDTNRAAAPAGNWTITIKSDDCSGGELDAKLHIARNGVNIGNAAISRQSYFIDDAMPLRQTST
ncbi:MAG: hypothetical protein WBD34_23250, partial [Burkholderiaceae bacterium]